MIDDYSAIPRTMKGRILIDPVRQSPLLALGHRAPQGRPCPRSAAAREASSPERQVEVPGGTSPSGRGVQRGPCLVQSLLGFPEIAPIAGRLNRMPVRVAVAATV
jgi:hypothetical protein